MEMRKTTRNTAILQLLDSEKNQQQTPYNISGENLINDKIALPNFITAKCPHNHVVKNYKI